MKSHCLALAVCSSLVAGCAGALPEPIYANQVDAYFPEDEEGASEGESLREPAEACAAHLNGRRSSAEIGSTMQGIISGFGGLVGAAGGVLSAIDWGNQDITTAMGVLGAVGAGITMIGNLIIGLAFNPVEELRLHGLGQRSWEMALGLRDANGDAAAVRGALERCTRDEAPELRVEGSGIPFSR